MTGRRLLALDALRGVAAIVVLLHHAEREFELFPLFAFGYLAVDVFFLMSGYVIAGAYEERMDQRMGLRAFLTIRLARLYPMIWLGGVLGIIAGAVIGAAEGPLWLAGLSALTAIPLLWHASVLFPLNTPLWSILFEVVANALHRIMAPILSIRVLCGVIAISLVLLLIAGWQLRGLANGFSPETFWGGFPRTFLSYFTGVLLYRTQTVWKPRAPSLALGWLLLGFGAIVVMGVPLQGHVPASAYWLAAALLIFPPSLMLLVRSRSSSRFERFAEALGDLSYPLYAIHMPLLAFSAPWLAGQESAQARLAAGLLVCLVIGLLALAIERLYDRPVRRALARRRRAGSFTRQ